MAKVKSIKFVGYADVYNMEVESHHNFAVNGGLIVHNCRYGVMSRPPITVDGKLDFPEDMPEIEKSRAIINIQFEDKYHELMKHRFTRRW